jgi:hypothetical protein
MHKLKGYKCSLSGKGATKENIGRGWQIVCFNLFEKITLDSSLVSAPYVPHF